MKHRRLLLVIVMIMTATEAFTQSSTFGIKAGSSHAYANGIDFFKSLGYYAGVTYEEKALNSLTGFSLETIFINQLHTVGGVTSANHILTASVGPTFYFKESLPLYVAIGGQAGYDIGYRINGDWTGFDTGIRFGGYAGLNYTFGLVQLQAKYIRELDARNMMQLGINYRFRQI